MEPMYHYMQKQAELIRNQDLIKNELYTKYNVKRGLRDLNGDGVMAGLTHVSTIKSKEEVDGVMKACPGELYYRGYNIQDLVKGAIADQRPGFEETAYLLLFGELPDKKELAEFTGMIGDMRRLPTNFVRDVIMKAPSKDIMNSMTRSVLTLSS